MLQQKHIFIGVLGGIILLGVYTFFIISVFGEDRVTMTEIHENSDYTFISPLLECNVDFEYYNPGKIKTTLNKYIEENKKSGDIKEVAYYMRMLKNGSTFGYNQEMKFVPASLVKIPFAISLMRQVSIQELTKEILITELPDDVYSGDEIPDTIEYGKSYTLYTLLLEMLINSDNTASVNILNYLNSEKGAQTYEKFGLGIIDFNTDKSLDISVKSYASFFRVLFNSSYLSRGDSEELLYLLSQSTFHSGIRALLPKNLTIANKFGSRELENGTNYIHDCGIIYAQSPYLLCIMTEGNNRSQQLNIIQNISKMIYDDVIQKS